MECEHVANEEVIRLAETSEPPNRQPRDGAKETTPDIHTSIANIEITMVKWPSYSNIYY